MRTHYLLTTSIRSTEEFAQRLLAHEGVLVSDDRCPCPPGRKIMLNLDDEAQIRLRHYASPTDAPSPILQLDFTEMDRGMQIRCEVQHAESPFSAAQRELSPELRTQEDFDTLFDYVLHHILAWLHAHTLRAWRHKLGMARYGSALIGLVKDTAEADGVVAPNDPKRQEHGSR